MTDTARALYAIAKAIVIAAYMLKPKGRNLDMYLDKLKED